jgi:hypothetical protein
MSALNLVTTSPKNDAGKYIHTCNCCGVGRASKLSRPDRKSWMLHFLKEEGGCAKAADDQKLSIAKGSQVTREGRGWVLRSTTTGVWRSVGLSSPSYIAVYLTTLLLLRVHPLLLVGAGGQGLHDASL